MTRERMSHLITVDELESQVMYLKRDVDYANMEKSSLEDKLASIYIS